MTPLLDLFCGFGLAADGWKAAGFEPVGIDIEPQPDYPYEFHKADALEVLRYWDLRDFAVITGSPPCQEHTRARHLRSAQGGESRYPDLLTPTLALLRLLQGGRWVIENVPGAPGMEDAVTVCGSSFGLHVQRHRLFLADRRTTIVGSTCDHSTFPPDPITGKPRPWGVYHVPGDSIPKGGRTCRDPAHAAECMGVTRGLPWRGLKEGYPPAYSEFIGRQIMEQI